MIKKTTLLLLLVAIFTSQSLVSQNVAITDDDGYTANPSAMLDVKSTNKGMLVPRLTTSQRNAISNPANGLLVFDSTEYVDWTSDDPEEPYAEVTVSFELWMGYTSDGLIASIGVDLKVDASIEEFPVGEDYNSETSEYTTTYADGTINMELNAEILNKDIDNIPNPTALPKDTEGEDGDGGGLPTPGFSIIPALILVAAISVFIKRRK